MLKKVQYIFYKIYTYIRYTVVKYFGVRRGTVQLEVGSSKHTKCKDDINLLKGGSVSEVKEELLALIP